MAADGAAMTARKCVDGTSGGATCGLSGDDRGVPISLESAQRGDYPQPNSLAMAIIPGEPSPPATTQPLPPVSSLGSLAAIPQSWRIPFRCIVEMPGGCGRYLGNLTLHGSASADSSALISTLERSNFSIGLDLRHPIATGARYSVGATKRLAAGGGDEVFLGAVLSDQADHTVDGQLFISAL
jgi:hypothetical protein